MKVSNDFVISPKELRTVEIRDQFRGYDHDEVNELFERAARTLEHLAALARGRTPQPPSDAVTARELVDTDVREVMRGYHKDTVNDLADRAARTIELLESRLDPAALAADRARAEQARAVAPAEPEPRIAVAPPAPVEPPTTAPDLDPVTARVATIDEPEPEPEPEPLAAPTPAATRDVIAVELGERSYEVHIGADAVGRLAGLVDGRRMVAVVSQAEILRQHGERVAAALDTAGVESEWFLIDDGEAAKTMTTVADVCGRMAAAGVLRGDLVVAFGGGIVGDVGGFVASVYHRGLDVIQVPTTLLAMVDSAIGGKTGVNLEQGKNLVGAFHQPRAVLADPAVLATLPGREFRCGLGEVAKYALMGDPELGAILTDELGAVLARDPEVLTRVVRRSAAMKAGFVMHDELERSGLRAHLNYGHTLAHAIETVAGHAYAHGEAVAVGLVFAGALAGALERIDAAAVVHHRDLIEGLGLPSSVPFGVSRDALLEVMRRDKKASGGLTFVLQGPRGLERVDDPPARAIDTALAAVGVS